VRRDGAADFFVPRSLKAIRYFYQLLETDEGRLGGSKLGGAKSSADENQVGFSTHPPICSASGTTKLDKLNHLGMLPL
jgi:hypothetical protein